MDLLDLNVLELNRALLLAAALEHLSRERGDGLGILRPIISVRVAPALTTTYMMDVGAAERAAHMPVAVQQYVPGYRLKQKVAFDRNAADWPLNIPGVGPRISGLKTSIFLEVEGAALYLPAYAGNLHHDKRRAAQGRMCGGSPAGRGHGRFALQGVGITARRSSSPT